MDTYDYRVIEVVRIVDGDTYDLTIALGFHLTAALRFRLAGVNTPEVYGPNATAAGAEASEFVRAWLEGRRLRARTYKAGAFGRWLADVYDADTLEDLGRALLEAGLAEVYRR